MKRLSVGLAMASLLAIVACGTAGGPNSQPMNGSNSADTQQTRSAGQQRYRVMQGVEDLKASGGGFVLRSDDKVSFGFAGHAGSSGPGNGRIEVNDHGAKTKFHGEVTSLECAGSTATLRGTLTTPVAGTFEAIVTDDGEPGRSDSFSFTTSTGYAVAGPLAGGNIQTHGACNLTPTPPPCSSVCSVTAAGTILNGRGTFANAFYGEDDSAATGQFTVVVNDPGETYTITNDTAIISCETTPDGTRDIVTVSGAATFTSTSGHTETGTYAFSISVNSGTNTMNPGFFFYFQGESRFASFDNFSGVSFSAVDIDTDAPCPSTP